VKGHADKLDREPDNYERLNILADELCDNVRASSTGIINGHHWCEMILCHVAFRNMCIIHQGSEDCDAYERMTDIPTTRWRHERAPHGKGELDTTGLLQHQLEEQLHGA
jgi:hypothetical protein